MDHSVFNRTYEQAMQSAKRTVKGDLRPVMQQWRAKVNPVLARWCSRGLQDLLVVKMNRHPTVFGGRGHGHSSCTSESNARCGHHSLAKTVSGVDDTVPQLEASVSDQSCLCIGRCSWLIAMTLHLVMQQ